jgi:uncharacterized membrane protein HdeD (DUF308 family)
VTGVLAILAAIRLRRELRGEWLRAIGGVISVVLGILLVTWPGACALTVTALIGSYAIVFGAVPIAVSRTWVDARQPSHRYLPLFPAV